MSALSHTRRLAVAALALSVCLAAGNVARADDDTAAAREHYQKGTSYYDLGRYPEAIHEFEAAYELKNDPALLYNLAQSHRLAGNTEQALHFYRTYLRRVPKVSNRAEIEERIAALEQALAQKGPTTSTTTGQTTPPPPDTGPGGGVTPPPPPPPDTTGTPPGPTSFVTATAAPPPRNNQARILEYAGIGAAGLGGLLFVVGIVEGNRASAAANEINNTALQMGTFDPAVEKRGQSAETAEKALIFTGVLLGAAGAGVYYYGYRTEQRARQQVSVTPVASAHGGGALLRVTF